MRQIHVVVEGKVQGVSFRAYTAQQAQLLGAIGWVRNCPDVRVELQVGGDPDAVDELVEWLWQGSPEAAVTAVTVTDVTVESDLPRPFTIVADATG